MKKKSVYIITVFIQISIVSSAQQNTDNLNLSAMIQPAGPALFHQDPKKEIPLKNGTVIKAKPIEPPFVYLENGEPAVFSVGVKKRNDTFIAFFKLKNNN